MASPSRSVAAALAGWRQRLLDLSPRNPLLTLRPTPSSFLTLSHPGPQAIFERLVRDGKTWSFWMPPVAEEGKRSGTEGLLDRIETGAEELVCGDLGRDDLLRVLANLHRISQTSHVARGQRVLHLAWGVLEGSLDDQEEPLRSPLVLLPVELSRASLQATFKLAAVDEGPLLNPTLQARLQQGLGFRLPALPEDWNEKSLTSYLQEVEAAISGLPGGRVARVALLALLPMSRGDMVRDLEENAERVAAHPLVRALAGEAVGAELGGGDLPDEDQPPESTTFNVLDADGSQRLCLEAAGRGQSFVIQGGPGTGKSQTIANLMSDCLAKGKTVLFVSAKRTALEVLYQRLHDVGLGDFCLELHGPRANTQGIVAELRRCLEAALHQPEALARDAIEPSFAYQAITEEQRSAYVKALHAVREPLRQSAWWALGELSRCEGVPHVPLGLADPADLRPDWLDQARNAVLRLQQLWHISEQGPDFPWWGFKAEDRFTSKQRDEVIALLDRVCSRIDRLGTAAQEYAGRIGADGSVGWLLRVADVLEASPGPPASWLTSDLQQLTADLERCAADCGQRGQSREPLTDRYGADIWRLPPGTAAKVETAWHAATPLLAAGDERGAALLTRQQQLRGWAADTQRRIPGWISEVRILEKWLGITLPRGTCATGSARSEEVRDDPSVQVLRRLHRLANLCVADQAPERTWLTDAGALEEARQLIQSARPVFADFNRRCADLRERYTDSYFELELDRIADGLAGPYQSWLRRFNMPFRRDRNAIRRRSRTEELPTTWEEDVPAARELLHDKKRLEAEQTARQAVLGRYEKGFATDFDAAERATRIAAEALELARELNYPSLSGRLLEALAAAGPPPEKIRAALKRLHDSLGAWQHATDELKACLPMDELPGTDAPLEECAVSALNAYARDLQASLNQFAAAADLALVHARTPPPDTHTLLADLRQAEELRVLEETQEQDAKRWAERLGSHFQGMATDWTVLRKALSWTTRLREVYAAPDRSVAGPMSEQFLRVATGEAAAAPSSRDLRHAREQLDQALHSLEHRFEPPAPQWQGRRPRELPTDMLRQRVETLRQRAGELADWVDWRHMAERFAQLGLATFWDGLQKERPSRAQLPDVFTRAALGDWLEDLFQKEPALAAFRGAEHERGLVDFRQLDQRMTQENVRRVAQLADSRRPSKAEAAVLMRAPHPPMRLLLDETSSFLLQLKPCLLMSPLSVSSWLSPEKFTFDLVIIDEASQLSLEDAVPAIYRGRQVVVLGDDQPVPPASRYREMEEDDGAGEAAAISESLLDACRAAGLAQRKLCRDYRSRETPVPTVAAPEPPKPEIRAPRPQPAPVLSRKRRKR